MTTRAIPERFCDEVGPHKERYIECHLRHLGYMCLLISGTVYNLDKS